MNTGAIMGLVILSMLAGIGAFFMLISTGLIQVAFG